MRVIKGHLDTTDDEFVDTAGFLAVPYCFTLGSMAFGSKISGWSRCDSQCEDVNNMTMDPCVLGNKTRIMSFLDNRAKNHVYR
jgi:hypothetical protein